MSAAIENQRISSCCDLANSGSEAVTANTQAVSEKRRIEVAGSNDRTTVKHSQAANSTKDGDSKVLSAVTLSRMASASVSTASAAYAI